MTCTPPEARGSILRDCNHLWRVRPHRDTGANKGSICRYSMLDFLVKASPLRARVRGPQPSAWKVNSANFTCIGFSEIGRSLERLPALGLVEDPHHHSDQQGQEQDPEQSGEQHAEEATAHHGSSHHMSHATHHAVAHPATGEAPGEQQSENCPTQRTEQYLQAVAHSTTSLDHSYPLSIVPGSGAS